MAKRVEKIFEDIKTLSKEEQGGYNILGANRPACLLFTALHPQAESCRESFEFMRYERRELQKKVNGELLIMQYIGVQFKSLSGSRE